MDSLCVLAVLMGLTAAAPQGYQGPPYPYVPAGYPYNPYSAPTYPYVVNPYTAPAPRPYVAPTYPTPTYNPQYVKPVAILRQSQDISFDGSFTYDFETENGISVQARGFLKDVGPEGAQVIQGQFSYTAPDGTPIVTQYIADETGFHPEGKHLPVPPADPYRIA